MRIVFAGTPDFSLPCLRALLRAEQDVGAQLVGVLTRPDRPAGRGRALRPSAVKQLAAAHELAIDQPRTLQDAAALAKLREWAPDMIIVVAYGLIFPQAVLDLPRLGCVNLHASLLPRWRGAAPIERAIEAGDKITGASLMQMQLQPDAGDIFAREQIAIGETDTGGDLRDKLAELCAQLLHDNLRELLRGELHAVAQNENEVTWAKKIQKQEAVIDWRAPAESIARRIRAFHPRPGAETRLRDWRLRVPQAVALPNESHAARPGEVLRADERGLAVACGEGVLCILQLQKSGARAMPVADFLRGNPIQAGDLLQ